MEIDELRKRFPTGTRVKLLYMDDMQAPPTGIFGTVDHIDDIGTIHVHWDTGSSLGLIFGEDSFEIIPNSTFQEVILTEEYTNLDKEIENMEYDDEDYTESIKDEFNKER